MGFLFDPQSSRTSSVTLLFLLGWMLIFVVESSVAAQVTLNWDVEYIHWTPDCIEGGVMGINGQFPGPTIKATAGDIINITLTNHLHTEGVVIHWHGITQMGTPWADGTASISQCAINAGESFQYIFKVEKAGTFFYHGHYGMQRSAGLYGSLIVSELQPSREPFRYDKDFTLLLSDWWHQNVHRQEVDLSAKPLRFIGEPQAILINGRGHYNCSIAAHFDKSSTLCNFTEKPQCRPEVLQVKPNKIYRIRIASTTALSSLNFMIQDHKLEVVEADGNYVQPFLVDDLDIYSGESYSVLLRTNQGPPSGNYWISIGVRGRKPMTPPALAVLNYYPMTPLSKHPRKAPPIHPEWDNLIHSKSFSYNIKAVKGGYNYKPPPIKQDRRIVLLNTQSTINGHTKWAINNISLTLPSTPYLGAIKYGIDNAFTQESPPDTYSNLHDIMGPPLNTNASYGNGVYKLAYKKTIDVILQNANMLKANDSEIHPWHLHGHDFWVLGYGEGKFSDADESKFNMKDPPLRNTVVVYPFGWTALRFVTDNPGVWAFHCHIEPHLHMGMGVIFAEGIEQIKAMEVNNEALVCGLTGKMFMKGHHN